MKVGVVVQARLGSTRLPRKVLEPIAGQPMLWHVLSRAKAIPGTQAVILATTDRPEDRALAPVAESLSVPCFFGSEADVLDRFYGAAREHRLDAVVRVTADCPLLDPTVSGLCVDRFVQGDVDYVTNSLPPSFPDGLDTEVVAFAALERAWREAALASEREHVTPYIWKNPALFKIANMSNVKDLSALRWSVDEPADLEFVRAVYAGLGDGKPTFGMDKVLRLLGGNPSLARINAGVARNAGYEKSLQKDRPVPPRRKPA